MGFTEKKAEELLFNPFTKIGREWMLITAGNEDKFNTMTASWGGVGVLWGKNTVTVYIRESRYTKEFVDAGDKFTVAFFGEAYREALNICGSVSGRDEDKVKRAGLTPLFLDGTAAFEEADMIFVNVSITRRCLRRTLTRRKMMKSGILQRIITPCTSLKFRKS